MLTGVIEAVILLAYLIGIVAGIAAIVFCTRTREDAFRAADKLTKPAWTAIVSASSAVLFMTLMRFRLFQFFSLFALVAIVVFWVDVYPKIKEILSPQDW